MDGGRIKSETVTPDRRMVRFRQQNNFGYGSGKIVALVKYKTCCLQVTVDFYNI